MASESVRELARAHPEEFRRVAERAEGQLGDHLIDVYKEETREVERQPVPA